MEKNQQQRCAACKYFRRRCSSKDCIFWPYFPSSDLEKFACVHKIYGASNVVNVLERVPVELRFKAVECMVFEAQVRANDPVYGSVGIISGLLHQIKQAEFELARIQGQIAFYKAQPILIE